jgi:hypothetical protein
MCNSIGIIAGAMMEGCHRSGHLLESTARACVASDYGCSEKYRVSGTEIESLNR